jgi:hypothetical protein
MSRRPGTYKYKDEIPCRLCGKAFQVIAWKHRHENSQRKLTFINGGIVVSLILTVGSTGYYLYARKEIYTAVSKGNIMAAFAVDIFVYAWAAIAVFFLSTLAFLFARRRLIQRAKREG